ncbi:MAG: cupin domain-containing protein [Candidatus Eremiobacteraeota bacterium]|nr:cupin domain-containing protein [Candidatus Eremiobacteraeota bacterium]
MQELAIPNAYTWSRWQPDRKMYFNSYLFVSAQGNIAVDPVALESDDIEQITALGGIAEIVVTNRDHLRETAALRELFRARVVTSAVEAPLLGLPVDRTVNDGEQLFPGANAVALNHQKTPGEFAIHIPKLRTVLVGDAIIGAPAGSLSLLPDEKYGDVVQAALGLRRVWALQPDVLLVGDGTSLWSGATRAIGTLLFKRAGIAVNRINLDELRYEYSEDGNGKYRSSDGEVGYFIGAERLGYQVVKLPPGARFCPVHAEFSEEELFVVLEGTPSIRTVRETLQCRKGDFIAFPVGPDHAHQVLNESSVEAMILLLGQNMADAVCYYPESEKVLIATPQVRWMVRNAPQLDYFDGE